MAHRTQESALLTFAGFIKGYYKGYKWIIRLKGTRNWFLWQPAPSSKSYLISMNSGLVERLVLNIKWCLGNSRGLEALVQEGGRDQIHIYKMHVYFFIKLPGLSLNWLYILFFLKCHWGLNSGPQTSWGRCSTTWATLPALFRLRYFWDRVSELFA
jgi:hypothetical protein